MANINKLELVKKYLATLKQDFIDNEIQKCKSVKGYFQPKFKDDGRPEAYFKKTTGIELIEYPVERDLLRKMYLNFNALTNPLRIISDNVCKIIYGRTNIDNYRYNVSNPYVTSKIKVDMTKNHITEIDKYIFSNSPYDKTMVDIYKQAKSEKYFNYSVCFLLYEDDENDEPTILSGCAIIIFNVGYRSASLIYLGATTANDESILFDYILRYCKEEQSLYRDLVIYDLPVGKYADKLEDKYDFNVLNYNMEKDI